MVRRVVMSVLLAAAVGAPFGATAADIGASLRGADVFAGVAPPDLERIGALAKVETLASGATLMVAGARAEAIYIIADGAAEVRLADGRAVASIGKGVTVGEMEFADDAPVSATVAMTAPGEAVVIDGAKLRAFLDANPAAGYRVMDNIARKISVNLRQRNEARCP